MSQQGADRPSAEQLVAAVEAVLFAAGEPVPPREIAAALGTVEEGEVTDALERLRQRLDVGGGGLRVEQVAGGVRLATRPEVGPWVRQFFRQRHRTRLSASALETLAIVAYRQPVTAPEIQAIRGLDPSHQLRSLLDKRMIRILGRKKVVGNPLLYGTTKQFLMHFGLDRLQDLPSLEEMGLGGASETAQGALFAPSPAGEDDPEAADLLDHGYDGGGEEE